MKIGIACAAGANKGVFVHGVLAALGETGFEADIYAASSSSATAAAYAAIGDLPLLQGPECWIRMVERYVNNGHDMSEAVMDHILMNRDHLAGKLFGADAKRLAIAVSAVVTEEAEILTQGPGARRLGKELMMAIRNRDASWARENLDGRLFESGSPEAPFKLNAGNLHEVLYATTRVLHAWKTPAWIEGRPYIDATYTCHCPAVELAEMGCDEVIAISPEEGPLYRDFFRSSVIPASYKNARIHVIRPKIDLAEAGVDYLKATNEGFNKVYELGREAGREFLGSGQIPRE